ncbi:MAG: RtcB family protein [Chloroflexota bacterium]
MISGKILKLRGWPEGKVIGLAKAAADRLEAKGIEGEDLLVTLDRVRATPGDYLADSALSDLARECLRQEHNTASAENDELRDGPLSYAVWGREQVHPEALAQMDAAMRLPISVGGALMPDAHVGYGLPIGGVLATQGAVIPYAVGVDIACRMRLSIYPVSPIFLDQRRKQFERALLDQTVFGAGGSWAENAGRRPEHTVLDDAGWSVTRLLKSLRPIAARQLGTSGTGNHFVEWGTLTVRDDADRSLSMPPGDYLALLSHSGSRGVGFKIANYYSALATKLHPALDQRARHLAWLDLNSEPGQEYWLAMELAGRFASANHQVIHRQVADAVGLTASAVVENHHNFAWRERLAGVDGDVIVHRKGATPAGKGVLGVIPGSMGDAGYIVRGLGGADSLNSAAHGAGRAMSRRKALQGITKTARDAYLRRNNVTLLGGGLDESPQAYKRIEEVMRAQADLVAVLGTFTPRLVRMADEPGET